MQMNFTKLTIWVIVLNFLIPIGAGHGIVVIGIIEILVFTGWNSEYFSLSLFANYEYSLGAAALFSLIGQVLLISSFGIRKTSVKFWVKISGLIFLWIGYYYLSHNMFSDSVSSFSFFFGLGFFICSIILTYKMIRDRKNIVDG